MILQDLLPLHNELCVQIQYESQWENLVGSMAGGCINLHDAMADLTERLEQTRSDVGCVECPEIRIPLPASTEQNFNALPFS